MNPYSSAELVEFLAERWLYRVVCTQFFEELEWSCGIRAADHVARIEGDTLKLLLVAHRHPEHVVVEVIFDMTTLAVQMVERYRGPYGRASPAAAPRPDGVPARAGRREARMGCKRLATVFYVARKEATGTLVGMLAQARATEVQVASLRRTDRTEDAICRWGGLQCEAFIRPLEYHQALTITFWQNHFLALCASDPGAEKREPAGATGLALAFRDACERLQPEVAFLVTHTWQAEPDFLRERDTKVLAMDANGLLGDGFGLLYLNEEVDRHSTPPVLRRPRPPASLPGPAHLRGQRCRSLGLKATRIPTPRRRLIPLCWYLCWRSARSTRLVVRHPRRRIP